MSNFLTKYLEEGQVIKCTENYHLIGLNDAGVRGVYAEFGRILPCYVKIIQPQDGTDSRFDCKVSLRPYDDFSEYIPYDKFYVQCSEKDKSNEQAPIFTARDVLNELYLIKQESGDVNELFDFFVSNDVDKLLDYLYENKMERLAEKEVDLDL